MAQTIKCRVDSIREDSTDLKVTVVMQFTNADGYSWKKEYPLKMTDDITVASFKNVLIEDLTRDLKPKTNMAAIQAQVGKEFTLSI